MDTTLAVTASVTATLAEKLLAVTHWLVGQRERLRDRRWERG